MSAWIRSLSSSVLSTSTRKTTSFIVFRPPDWGIGSGSLGIVPASRRRHVFFGLAVDAVGSPTAGFIVVHRRLRLEHGIDDTPGFLDIVLPREQRAVAVHGVGEHALT